MKTTWHKIFLIVVFLSCGQVVWAQEEDCSEKLKKAQSAYDNGILESVKDMVLPCIQSDRFTKPEKVQAYKLLTLIGLFEDNFAMAEENMTNLLKTDPDFEPKSSDPFELKDLYSKFRTDPVFTLGIKAGLNIGYATMMQYNSVGRTNTPDFNWVDGYSSLGFQAGLSYNHRIDKGLYINFDPRVTIMNHRMEEVLGADSIILVIKNEQNTMISGELGLSYDFRYRKPFKPYVEAGVAGFYFLDSKAGMEKRYTDNSALNVQESEVNLLGKGSDPEYNPESNRTQGMFAAYYGFGIKYKMGNGHFLFGIRHVLGQTNVTKNKVNPALYGSYDFVLKDITLNGILFNVGYVHSIYMPKILKRYLKKE